MTTTVKRGAGRKAATARTTKATQNPEAARADRIRAANVRKSKTADAAVAELERRAEYAAMKINDLRKLAREVGYSSATRMDKAGLVELLAANPDGPASAVATREAGRELARLKSNGKPAKPAVAPEVRAEVGRRQAQITTEQSKPAAPKVRTYRPVTPGLAGDGTAKAAAVAALLKAAGWTVKTAGTWVEASHKDGRAVRLEWTERGAYVGAGTACWFRKSTDAPDTTRPLRNVATAMRMAR